VGSRFPQHVDVVIDSRHASAGRRVPLPLPQTELELAHVLRVAKHLSDARVHPTRTGLPSSSRRGHTFRIQLLCNDRVAVTIGVQGEDATDDRSLVVVHLNLSINHPVTEAPATGAVAFSVRTSQSATRFGAEIL